MKWYCEKCKKIHSDDEMCPHIKKQIKDHPEWLKGAADFVTVAGENVLISSQALDHVAKSMNKLTGTELSYEGTKQYARDVQVFKRLNDEPFSRSGHFSTPEAAKSYLQNVKDIAKDNPRAMTSYESKLTGYGQEVDWLRRKQGEISSLWRKSTLLDNNAAGVDGVTVNRFTGKEINRTTIKASKNLMTKSSTGIQDVKDAIEKGYATSNDIIYGPKGTAAAAKQAGLTNRVIEDNSYKKIQVSNKRLESKIMSGQATTSVTLQQVGKQATQGMIVGAAVSVSISAISNYVRYKNGDLSKEEAFRDTSEDAIKGALVGGALGAATIFLPGGIIGFVGGMAVGIYFNKVCTNILDEIYGKGAYGAIMNASGYVYGMTMNLADYYEKIDEANRRTKYNVRKTQIVQDDVQRNFEIFKNMKENKL